MDFIIVDEQAEERVNELAQSIGSTRNNPKHPKIIHLFTPTSENLSKQTAKGSIQAGVVRLTKPPRRLRLLYAVCGSQSQD